MDGLQTCGDDNACKMFVESVRGKKFRETHVLYEKKIKLILD